MRFLLIATMAGILLGSQANTQEQKAKPQTISTEPKEITAELIVDARTRISVRGEAVFTPTVGNSDDTLAGLLLFKISQAERQRIAQVLNRPTDDISSDIQQKDVLAIFEKHPKCPDLVFEFFSFETQLIGISLRFKAFKLIFRESSQELSQVLCRWAKLISNGRGHPQGAAARFNRLLSGEEEQK